MASKADTSNIPSFNNLVDAVNGLDKAFADNTAKAINRNITARNWLIGYYIVNYEQNGCDRAKYGAKTLQTLAERLNSRSMSYRNLKLYRQFFMEFPSLAQPICDYIIKEFENELNTIGQPLVAQLGSGEMPIWQPMVANFEEGSIPIWQSTIAKLENSPMIIEQSMIAQLNSDLQLPADKLFSRLSVF